jgi:hypothetical protein
MRIDLKGNQEEIITKGSERTINKKKPPSLATLFTSDMGNKDMPNPLVFDHA